MNQGSEEANHTGSKLPRLVMLSILQLSFSKLIDKCRAIKSGLKRIIFPPAFSSDCGRQYCIFVAVAVPGRRVVRTTWQQRRPPRGHVGN